MLFKLETSKLRNMLLVYSKTHISWRIWVDDPILELGLPESVKILEFLFFKLGISKFKDILLVYPKAHINCNILVCGPQLRLGSRKITIITSYCKWSTHKKCKKKFTGCGNIYYTEGIYWLPIMHWGLCDRLIALVIFLESLGKIKGHV